jgi:hypothetical protein
VTQLSLHGFYIIKLLFGANRGFASTHAGADVLVRPHLDVKVDLVVEVPIESARPQPIRESRAHRHVRPPAAHD